jgi:putative phosphoribosyl transferase
VRKIGVPGQPELAMGAVASGGILVVNQDVLHLLHLPESAVADAAVYARQQLEQQEEIYRGSRPRAPIANRHVILVDDGLATGSTMRAAVRGVKTAEPQKITVAVPVGSPATCRELVPEADEVVCVHTPDPFSSVGEWYQDFGQTSEDEVRALLKRADAEHSGPGVSD